MIPDILEFAQGFAKPPVQPARRGRELFSKAIVDVVSSLTLSACTQALSRAPAVTCRSLKLLLSASAGRLSEQT